MIVQERGSVTMTARDLANLEAAIRGDEYARVRQLVQAQAARLRELGRARDADRWRAFDEWLRATKKADEVCTPPASSLAPHT